MHFLAKPATATREQTQNDEIEKELKAEARAKGKEHKILLLDEHADDREATVMMNSVKERGKGKDLAEQPDASIVEARMQVGATTHNFVHLRHWHRGHGDMDKWMQCFENVTAIAFFADLCDYNVMELDENRLLTSITHFDNLCSSRWVSNVSIILFLNIEGLPERLSESPPDPAHFPGYTGGGDYDKFCDYALHRFISLNQHPGTSVIYAHYVTSTNQETTIKFILSAIVDIALSAKLNAEADKKKPSPRPLTGTSR
ncbi:Guanine nucleotide binding protein, alpha subunit [Mycena indigotica]|uniref:Guanine nucleotide binding protein, alpha subunit n=1 Tax=Mycena indigotica TaxID=2126181 RepID=A0A8H6VSB9_9AGAR|nr:Guanine nucleotide binding protein, alpha subunit [Mycena indigotica]KAF7292019.1 Guanine nucleotide binding protein, alpha subunit [Mycena indigotica]